MSSANVAEISRYRLSHFTVSLSLNTPPRCAFRLPLSPTSCVLHFCQCYWPQRVKGVPSLERAYSLTSGTTMQYYLFNSRAWLAVAAFVAFACHDGMSNPLTSGNNIVNVDIYYESLCGDSKRFITTQLAPSYGQLKDYIHVTFIPYGKATHVREGPTSPWQFQCQHGATECRGNKAQSCAIDAIKSSETAENQEQLMVNVVNCAMSSRNPSTAVPQCARDFGLREETRTTIDSCIESSRGDDLLAANGDKTAALNPPLTFVPTIVINGVYSQENEDEALRNFPSLICRHLTEKPSVCRN